MLHPDLQLVGQIECQFGPLREFVLDNSDHPSHLVVANKIHAYLRWRNSNAKHPDVLAAQRRERARRRLSRTRPLRDLHSAGSTRPIPVPPPASTLSNRTEEAPGLAYTASTRPNTREPSWSGR